MTLFFPSKTDNTKISSSNNEVNISVGDSMSISAGNSFLISGGSSSIIKIGPATNFILGSAVNINIASSLSYSFGYSASYGGSTSAMSTTSSAKAIDSYEIQAGVYTAVKKINLTQIAQVLTVVTATIISMGAIAIAIVGGLSSPLFVKDSDINNPNAIVDKHDEASAICAMSITTVSVFMLQWALTYILAKSSTFTPVTKMIFNNTGISASVQTSAANTANLLLAAAKLPVVPSVETTMYAPALSDSPTYISRVNEAPIAGSSPQLSEVILTPNKISLNSTTQPSGVAVHNTQIIMDSASQKIKLYSDSVEAPKSGGSIIIGKNTEICNPDGDIELYSESIAGGMTSGIVLESGSRAVLLCGDGTPAGTGAVTATTSAVNIGVAMPGGGNAVFNSAGTTISGGMIKLSGTSIDIGGALTILGSPGTVNTNLSALMSNIVASNAAQIEQQAEILALQAEINILKKSIEIAQEAAKLETLTLNSIAETKASTEVVQRV